MQDDLLYVSNKQHSNNKKWKLVLLTIVLSLIYLFALNYIDIKLISPIILPNDYCYYHNHETPWWVELLYMTPSSNGHPDGSFFKLLLFLILASYLGYITSKAIINKRTENKHKMNI